MMSNDAQPAQGIQQDDDAARQLITEMFYRANTENSKRKIRYRCEYCHEAVFQHYEECVAHESECAALQDAKRSLKLKRTKIQHQQPMEERPYCFSEEESDSTSSVYTPTDSPYPPPATLQPPTVPCNYTAQLLMAQQQLFSSASWGQPLSQMLPLTSAAGVSSHYSDGLQYSSSLKSQLTAQLSPMASSPCTHQMMQQQLSARLTEAQALFARHQNKTAIAWRYPPPPVNEHSPSWQTLHQCTENIQNLRPAKNMNNVKKAQPTVPIQQCKPVFCQEVKAVAAKVDPILPKPMKNDTSSSTICCHEDCQNIAVGYCRTNFVRKLDARTCKHRGGCCISHLCQSTYICAHEGCKARVRKGESVCMTHEYRGQMCTIAGCINIIDKKGMSVCNEHLTLTTCIRDGCSDKAVKGGVCTDQQGKPQCKHEGCKRASAADGVCDKHCTRVICSYRGCRTTAQLGGLCNRHGGGKELLFSYYNNDPRMQQMNFGL